MSFFDLSVRPRVVLVTVVMWMILAAGCASPPRVAPRFAQPSTAPIAQAHQAAQRRVQAARVIVKQIGVECPAAKAQIEALGAELDGAQVDLLASENARVTLDAELKAQTDKANGLAANYDKLSEANQALKKTVDQVNRYWGLGAFGYGFKRLVRHLFVLMIILAVVAAALFALSFFFPVIGVAFSAAATFVKSIFARFKRK